MRIKPKRCSKCGKMIRNQGQNKSGYCPHCHIVVATKRRRLEQIKMRECSCGRYK